MLNALILTAALLSLACLGFGWSTWRERRRHREFVRLLDSADALEEILHRARRKMADMKHVVGRVAPDIGAVAQASLEDAPVQQGLRNVLEHRLWIAKNGETASYEQLRDAVVALQRSHDQIATRLAQLDSAGAELSQAARAVEEQEAREPSSLRRGTDPGGR